MRINFKLLIFGIFAPKVKSSVIHKFRGTGILGQGSIPRNTVDGNPVDNHLWMVLKPCKVIGITYLHLNWWVKTGFQPTIKQYQQTQRSELLFTGLRHAGMEGSWKCLRSNSDQGSTPCDNPINFCFFFWCKYSSNGWGSHVVGLVAKGMNVFF